MLTIEFIRHEDLRLEFMDKDDDIIWDYGLVSYWHSFCSGACIKEVGWMQLKSLRGLVWR